MKNSLLEDVQCLMNDYLSWLKNKTILKQLNDEWIEIETPYLDRHNDCLSIYLRRYEDNFELTDGGYIINDLRMSGCSLDKGQRHSILLQTLNAFGIKLNKDEALITRASLKDFPVKKHNLIQAMITINDLFFTTTMYIEKLFLEYVRDWLEKNDVRYSENIKIGGKTGFDQVFNFIIPKSKRFPERFVQAINTPKKENVQSILFRWEDIKTERKNAKLYVVLNDKNNKLPDNLITALRNYDLCPILWTCMDDFKYDLAG